MFTISSKYFTTKFSILNLVNSEIEYFKSNNSPYVFSPFFLNLTSGAKKKY